jgi:acyl-CoA synthetase (AMP-forming)/AMP-acid ligase II
MIAAAIFDWAQRVPDKTAIVYDGEPWSYRSFADAIAAARGFFAARSCAGPGVAVLAMSHMRDFWVHSLALRSLGMTTVLVGSVEAMGELRLPDIRCVVASGAEPPWPGLAERCAWQGRALIAASFDRASPLDLDPTAPRTPGGHILLTSGTTGRSKQLLMDPSFETAFLRRRQETDWLTHDAVANVFNFAGWTGIGYKTPAAAWLAGATVVIQEAPDLHRALLHPGITHSRVVPEVLAAVLAAPRDAFPRSDGMRLSIAGSSATQAQIDEARARITPHLFAIVAATETDTFCRTPLETPEDRRWHRPVPGRVVEIVDERDRPVPAGEIGRLRVGTAGGPTGYLYDREATRTFFKDGFFYTGDLAVMRPDGRLALQGRITSVIHVGGRKMSPEPIEDRLREALGVSGVCLMSMPDERGEEQIHVVIEAAAPLVAERLSAALRQELRGFPEARIYYAVSLPRTVTGKVQRQTVRAQIAAAIVRHPP